MLVRILLQYRLQQYSIAVHIDNLPQMPLSTILYCYGLNIRRNTKDGSLVYPLK